MSDSPVVEGRADLRHLETATDGDPPVFDGRCVVESAVDVDQVPLGAIRLRDRKKGADRVYEGRQLELVYVAFPIEESSGAICLPLVDENPAVASVVTRGVAFHHDVEGPCRDHDVV